MVTPVPDRKSLFHYCTCGKLPRFGMNEDDRYRVACMQMAGGCGITTAFFKYKRIAQEYWNEKFPDN